MKLTWSERQQKLVPTGKQNSEFDSLPLPGGESAANLSTPDLTRLLQKAGVPGVSNSNGRDTNLAAYAAHLETIRKQAADNAVAEWVRSKS